MNADDKVRLSHMLEAAEGAVGFCTDKSYDDLLSNRQLAFAVVRALEIVGEAASQLSDDFKASHDEIPWRDVIAMRNKLIHAYFDINYRIVWSTVTNDLPVLIPILREIIT